jgi:formylmethanofuran dehydrogenase subunit C
MGGLCLLLTTCFAFGTAEINWSTVDGGGATMVGGNVTLSGTAGQPDAGRMSGGSITLTGGFWAVESPAPVSGGNGDCDSDGDVDLVDFGQFQLCFTGPGGSIAGGCSCSDFDGDNDADLVDFGQFQLAFTGPM